MLSPEPHTGCRARLRPGSRRLRPRKMGAGRRAGYTLLEMLVVMVLLGLAAAVVLPALVTPPHDTTPLRDLIATTQEAAADRGEVLYLRIDAVGAWQLESANPREGTLDHGRLPQGGAPLTLIVSPLGSCAPDVPSAASGASPALDALGCDLARPAAHPGP